MDEETNLPSYLAVLRRRWRTVVICVIVSMAVSLGLALTQADAYRASTSLEVSPTGSVTSNSGVVIPPSEIATQVQVLLSTPVADRVRDELNLDMTSSELLKSVTVSSQGDTRVISIDALEPTAELAQAVADSFARQYLSFRLDQATAQNSAALASLSAEATRIRDELRTVQKELASATGNRLAVLQTEQQALLVQLTQVLQDQATASLEAPNSSRSGGQVLVSANLPSSPAEPKPIRSTVLGALIGLILGVGLAFVRDRFDDAVRDEQRLRETIGQRAILGRIPVWQQARTGRVTVVMDPNSAASEAYRALTANIRFTLAATRSPALSGVGEKETATLQRASAIRPTPAPRRSGRSLLIASAMQSEGKTSVASNVAVLAAGFGLNVILVDADLRNPNLSSDFGLGHPPGLTDLLSRDGDVEEYLIDVEGIKLLPGGTPAPNPAELLASPGMRDLLTLLTERADLVVVDTAPVLRVADTLELVTQVDQVVLVVRHGQSRLRSVTHTVEQITQVGGHISGAVYVGVPRIARGDIYGEPLPRERPPAAPPEKVQVLSTPGLDSGPRAPEAAQAKPHSSANTSEIPTTSSQKKPEIPTTSSKKKPEIPTTSSKKKPEIPTTSSKKE